MKLSLLVAAALLSAVSASYLSGKAWGEAHHQQDDGQDDYSDGTLQNFPGPQQDGGDGYDFAEELNAALQQEGGNNDEFAELEKYDSELHGDMENDFVGLQQGSEDEPGDDFGKVEQDGYPDDEDVGELQQDEGDNDYSNELNMLLQQEGGYDDEEPVATAAQDDDEEGEEDGTAVAQWNNRWDGPLHVRCRAGYGLYYVYSIHNNRREDRLFNWRCKRVFPVSKITRILRPILHRMKKRFYMRQCQLAGCRALLIRNRRKYYNRVRRLRHYYYHRRYLRHTNCFARKINTWDRPMNYRCPTHSYLTGLRSYHHNKREDREWTAYCCRTPGVCLRSCRWTGYVNNWDAPMKFSTRGVFTGLISYHSNRKEDRRWRIRYCYSRKC